MNTLMNTRPYYVIACAILLAMNASSCIGEETVVTSDVSDSISKVCCDAELRGEPQFEQGRPNKFVDRVGWVLGIPNKILLWDRRAENHQVSEETQIDVAEYLHTKELTDVKVRVNQYDPGGEWRRLVENKRIGAGWRYTFGAVSTLAYTIFPGRIMGSDSYNPFTNTVHVYSDITALALEQAAFAQDVKSREWPGTYAAVQSLPIVGLWHEKLNKEEVHEYLSARATPAERAEAHRVLDPQFGSEIGEQIGTVIPGTEIPIQLTGAAIGHVIGRQRASKIETE